MPKSVILKGVVIYLRSGGIWKGFVGRYGDIGVDKGKWEEGVNGSEAVPDINIKKLFCCR